MPEGTWARERRDKVRRLIDEAVRAAEYLVPREELHDILDTAYRRLREKRKRGE